MGSVLLRVKPCARPSATEALHHPFLTRRTNKSQEPSVFFQGKVSASWGDRDRAWSNLDGLQRLGWVAVARAVAEPELDRSVISAALDGVDTCSEDAFCPSSGSNREATYLWQLAHELGTTPVVQWLQERGAWADIVRLAFCYLDLDADGLLSPQDLAGHLVGSPQPPGAGNFSTQDGKGDNNPWGMACRWVSRWANPDMPPAMTTRGFPGLSLNCFRHALQASYSQDDAIFNTFSSHTPHRGNHRFKSDSVALDADGKPVTHEEEEISWTDMVSGNAGML